MASTGRSGLVAGPQLETDALADEGDLRRDHRLAHVGDRGTAEARHRDRVRGFLAFEVLTDRDTAVLDEVLTVQLVGADLEALPGHTERRGERALCEADAHRRRGDDARHHDQSEPLPSRPTANLGTHTCSFFSDVHLRPGVVPVLGWEKCYVLGKESARIGDVSRIRSTGVHPRATTTGRAFRAAGRTGPTRGREPPVRGRRLCRRPLGGDPTDPRAPAGDRAEGIGPSVADRGAFTAATQGGSLLASNGPITTGRQGGITRRRRVARKGHRNGGKLHGNRTESPTRLTASNSLHLCQDLVKRGLLAFFFGVGTAKRPRRPGGSAADLSHRNNRARPERTADRVRTGRGPARCARR